MSEFAAYTARLNVQEQVIRIDRMIAETQKLISESAKLVSASTKLQAGGQKFSRERFLAPALVGVSILSGIVAVVTLVLHAGGR